MKNIRFHRQPRFDLVFISFVLPIVFLALAHSVFARPLLDILGPGTYDALDPNITYVNPDVAYHDAGNPVVRFTQATFSVTGADQVKISTNIFYKAWTVCVDGGSCITFPYDKTSARISLPDSGIHQIDIYHGAITFLDVIVMDDTATPMPGVTSTPTEMSTSTLTPLEPGHYGPLEPEIVYVDPDISYHDAGNPVVRFTQATFAVIGADQVHISTNIFYKAWTVCIDGGSCATFPYNQTGARISLPDRDIHQIDIYHGAITFLDVIVINTPTPTATNMPTRTATMPTNIATPTDTPTPTATNTPTPIPTSTTLSTPTDTATPTPPNTPTSTLMPCPTQAVSNLIEAVNVYVAEGNILGGVGTSLSSKLQNIQQSLSRDQINPAINELQAFVNAVQAQAGKKITTLVANNLIVQAQAIITQLQVMSCPSTPTPIPTGIITPTPSQTPTWTPTGISTQTPSRTSTRTTTPARTITQTPSRTPTRTITPTPTKTLTPSRTPTRTPIGISTPTRTVTSTRTPTRTITRMPSRTPTRTPTRTITRTPSRTPTRTITPTRTPTRTITRTPTHTITWTPSRTPTRTVTPSETPTRTITQTPSQTSTPTQTLPPPTVPTITSTPTIPGCFPAQTQTQTNGGLALAGVPLLGVTLFVGYDRKRRKTWVILCLILALSMSACGGEDPTSEPTQTVTPSPTDTCTPTSTPSSTPTLTLTPSPTSVPSPTSTPTLTGTPTPLPGQPNCNGLMEDFDSKYGIQFISPENISSLQWTDEEKIYVRCAVRDVAEELTTSTVLPPEAAFQDVYGINPSNPFIFEHNGNVGGEDAHGVADDCSSRHIYFEMFQDAYSSIRYPENYRDKWLHWVVHELGHAFENAIELGHSEEIQSGDVTVPTRALEESGISGGFAGGYRDFNWQQRWDDSYKEQFADTFLGWVYDTWETDGNDRDKFMESHMRDWIDLLVEEDWVSPICESGN